MRNVLLPLQHPTPTFSTYRPFTVEEDILWRDDRNFIQDGLMSYWANLPPSEDAGPIKAHYHSWKTVLRSEALETLSYSNKEGLMCLLCSPDLITTYDNNNNKLP